MHRVTQLVGLALALPLAVPARATVFTTTSVVEYRCNGILRVFTVPFRFLAQDDLRVSRVLLAAPYSETILPMGSAYAVGGAGNATGGTVSLVKPSAGCATGYKLRIRRLTPRTQGTALSTPGPLNLKALEAMADRQTMIAQELNDGALLSTQNLRFLGPTADAGLVTAAGGNTPIPLSAWFAYRTNIRAFGAAGDGVTDDTVAINAAIAATPSGGDVYAPAGTYKISPGQVTINKSLTLSGADWNGTVFTGSGGSLITVRQLSTDVEVQLRDLQVKASANNESNVGIDIGDGTNPVANWVLRRVKVMGVDPGTGIGNAGTGMKLSFALKGRIDDCRVEFWSIGVWNNGSSPTGSNANLITGSKIRQNRTGIKTNADDLWIDGSIFEGNITALHLLLGTVSVKQSHFEVCMDGILAGAGYVLSEGNHIACSNAAIRIPTGTNTQVLSMFDQVEPSGVKNESATGALTKFFEAAIGSPTSGIVNTWTRSHIGTNRDCALGIVGGTGGKFTAVSGISSGATAGSDLAGEFSITGAATSYTVAFRVAEPDVNYRVVVSPLTCTGTCAAGSNRVLSVAKTAAGFTVTLESAPGAHRGGVMHFDWHILR